MGLLTAVPGRINQPIIARCTCGKTLCPHHNLDPIHEIPMSICWSLSQAKEITGRLAEPSQHTKDVVQAESLFWHARDSKKPEWERFLL